MKRRTDRVAVTAVVIALLCLLVTIVVSYTTLHNRGTLSAIQDERRQAVSINCKDVTNRHDDAIIKLDRGIAAIKDPKQRARAEASKAFTIVLIDALVPRRDRAECNQLADQLVKAD